MTTGAPIYLVSSCASGEEFVAAFRRYADRAGLFVPSAAPLPVGKRGRVALTLTNGGVMIEGEVEVLQSSAKPQGLHGRPGMTLKFVEPDEPSKVVLGELEKARLAMKPQPPSVSPRAAAIPSEPRAVVPAVGGRIDAANALAECVVIGDVGALRDMGSARPGAKFVIPAIPARPKTPSTPAVGMTGAPPEAAPAPAASPPSPPPAAPEPVPEPARSGPIAVSTRTTSYGMPVIERLPAKPAPPAEPAVAPARPPTPPAVPVVEARRPPTPPAVPVVEAKRPPTPPAVPVVEPPAPKRPTPPPTPVVAAKLTSIGMPVVERPPAAPVEPALPRTSTSLGVAPVRVHTMPFGVPTTPEQRANRDDPTTPLVMRQPAMPRRAHTPSSPPLPRRATPVAPLPIARVPAAPAAASEEPTDLSGIPAEQLAELAADESGRAYVGPPPMPPAMPEPPAETPASSRSGGMRASEIMAALPNEDWTMTPDASGPTLLPPKPPPEPPEPAVPRTPTPTGDWTITADPTSADGWSAPARLGASTATGNPVTAVASDKPIHAVVWEDKPTGIGEPKIEIDPTLMEPLRPMPPADEPAIVVDAVPVDVPPPLPPPGFMPGPLPASYMTPGGGHPQLSPDLNPQAQMAMFGFPPGGIGDGGTGFFHDSGQLARYPSGEVVALEGRRRKRMLAIAVGAALAVAAAIALIIALVSSKNTAAASHRERGGSGSSVAAVKMPQVASPGSATPPAGSATPMIQPTGSNPAAVPADAAVAAPTTCSIDVTSSPLGVQIALDEADTNVIATTPATITLPCNVQTRLYLRKAKYFGQVKDVTPSPAGDKLDIHMLHAMFSVRVTSTPPGATITIGGRTLGVTPTTIRLPAYEASTITIAKDGYASDSQRLAPRTNGTLHHVALKRAVRHH
ncbi:MAG TPA: PEGA domain-containing protein [Kofleriaceae bacterium]|nr:PEGA domain-containing protein [Kofleriaceae bacterium]